MATKVKKVTKASKAAVQAEDVDEKDDEETTAKPSRRSRSKSEPEIKRFRLLAGTHIDFDYDAEPLENGLLPTKSYTRGQIVRSAVDLDTHFGFKNKFQRLPDQETAEAKKIREAEEGYEEPEKDSKGTKIVKGTRAQDVKYPGTRLDRNPADHVYDQDDINLHTISSDLGENVTEDFPNATAAGLAVFEKDGEYHLADPDSPDEAVKDGEGLTKAEVKAFLRDRMTGK